MTGTGRSRWRLARRVTAGVAGAAAVAAAGTAAALAVQIVVTRRRIPEPLDPPPRGDISHGRRSSRAPLTMALLGDSFAAGYGVDRSRETPAALLAAGISRRLRCRVQAHTLAVVGAESPDLCHQVDEALGLEPGLAVIYIGGNDVTQLAAQNTRVRQLGAAVRRLRAVGAEVVVGTCPDLSTVPPFRPPLRWLARYLSRRLAAAQTVQVVKAGGTTVSLADLLNPIFAADPDRMFGRDRFHPSADGYARAAAVTLPTVLAVLAEARGLPAAGTLENLDAAAREAAAHPGVQVHPARRRLTAAGPAGEPAAPYASVVR
jgi:lysophospholipase L1-like esterase